jgi:hypothetical protein
VIEVGVRQDHGIDGVRRDGQVLPVSVTPLFLALKEAAIYEHLESPGAFVFNVDEMFGTGDDACRPEKLDVVQACLASRTSDGCTPRRLGSASRELMSRRRRHLVDIVLDVGLRHAAVIDGDVVRGNAHFDASGFFLSGFDQDANTFFA